MGLMVQSGSYGKSLSNRYGCIKVEITPIWLQDLRKGKSAKKGKKKKGPPTWVANADIFIGVNPIHGVLTIEANKSDFYPLDFVKVSGGAFSNGGPFPFWPFVTLPADANFYEVVAVTVDVALSGVFNDFGGPGPVPYSGTYEYPLWNAAHHGPDLINAAGSRWWPYVYYWTPAVGFRIYLPSYQSFLAPSNGIPFGLGTYNVYYAKKSAVLKHRDPLSFNRFSFEQVLADGDEYVNAGVPLQQNKMPAFAGIQSSNMDCGSGPAIPAFRPEVHGSYTFLPPRDAEFMDMVEDIFKGAQVQTGEGLGWIHRGLNCNNLPGPVQKSFFGQLEPEDPSLVFSQPNAAGSILIAFYRWRFAGGPNPTISDVAGNTWNPVTLSTNCGFWWAQAVAAAAGNIVTGVFNGANFPYDSRAYVLEMDPGSNTIEDQKASQGVTGTAGNERISCAVRITKPSYIIVAGEIGSPYTNLTPNWDDLTTARDLGQPIFMKRYCAVPGVYTFGLNVVFGNANYNIGMIAISGSDPSPLPKTLGNILDEETMFLTRLQCRAGGLQGSLDMNSQRDARDWVKDILMCANAAPVWDGSKLEIIPRSEVSAVGLGAVYNAPTNPVIDLTESDFIADPSGSIITIDRDAPVNEDNVIQVQCLNRDDRYNPALVMEPEAGSVALHGPTVASPINLPMLVDPAVGRKIATIEGRRNVYLKPKPITFKLKANLMFLKAMAVARCPDFFGTGKRSLRITKIVENENNELECEAEPLVFGVHSPDPLLAPTLAPFRPAFTTIPASVNAPIFIEPVQRLQSSSPQGNVSQPQQLWIVVSDSDPEYGGAVVLVSVDGGGRYDPIGQTVGNAVTGITTADWPIANDPDTTNDLPVDLTESIGELDSYQVADEDAFTHPCYIEHGTAATPYGLMTYALANLTAANKYTLKATGGNKLRRCVFGAPQPLTDVDHPSGSRFAFLDPAGTGIFKINLDPKWIGLTLNFKFLAYNKFQAAVEDQASVTAYTYTPSGVAQAADPSNHGYSITGGTLTNPTTTTIHVDQATVITPTGNVNYNASTITIPAPSVPTTYYVTIYDPQHIGDTGATANLARFAETTQAKVGQPGYVYLGSIVAIAAGGGTITSPGGDSPSIRVYINGVFIP